MKRICPKCGASNEEKPFVGSFCLDCFLENNPDIVTFKEKELPVCTGCGLARIRGRWVPIDEDSLHRFLEGVVKTRLDNARFEIVDVEERKGRIFVRLVVSGNYEGVPISLERELGIKTQMILCPVCAKEKTKYWEAKIQFRGDEESRRKLSSFALGELSRLAERDREAGIVRVQELKEGIDLYLGSKGIARVIVSMLKRKFDLDVKTSYKLVGEDVHKGKRKYKVTYSVRVMNPEFRDSIEKSLREYHRGEVYTLEDVLSSKKQKAHRKT